MNELTNAIVPRDVGWSTKHAPALNLSTYRRVLVKSEVKYKKACCTWA